MRYSFMGLATIIAVAIGGLLIYQVMHAGIPVVLPPPAHLQMSAAQSSAASGGWINSGTLTLSARLPGTESAGMDVEVQPDGQGFTNAPTKSIAEAAQPLVACQTGSACGQGALPAPKLQIHLPDGHYRWQARLHNGRGVSPWIHYQDVINIDTTPPTTPTITSPTDPDPGQIYHYNLMRFNWRTSDDGSGIAGYSYRLDTDPRGVATTAVRTVKPVVALGVLDTGTYYFHVRALDHAGNWGTSATFPIHIDVTPPSLAHVWFSRFQFNPMYNALRVSFAVTKPTRTIHMGVYDQRDNRLVRMVAVSHLGRGQNTSVWWNGKDQYGRRVRQGTYAIYIRAIDQYGHSSLSGWRDFVINYQRIVISLSQQKLVAYDGDHVFLSSLVTTGNRALPTPTGTYQVMALFHPYKFISPWPKSSPYYYKPSNVSYAMLFRDGGYFIHDAPWRNAFGPGTNQQLGTPGNNYTGTHGCVNTPLDVAQRLFNWVQIGTVVQVTG